MVVGHDPRPSTSFRRLDLRNLTTSWPFLVDIVAEVSVTPRDNNDFTAAQTETLQAANGTVAILAGILPSLLI